jgi:hypothetical protein
VGLELTVAAALAAVDPPISIALPAVNRVVATATALAAMDPSITIALAALAITAAARGSAGVAVDVAAAPRVSGWLTVVAYWTA